MLAFALVVVSCSYRTIPHRNVNSVLVPGIPHPNCPWLLAITPSQPGMWSDAAEPLRLVASLTTVPGYVDWLTLPVRRGLFYASLVWVAALVSAFAYTMLGFLRGAFPVLWPLRVLRGMGALSTSVLYIPLLYVLLGGLSCGLNERSSLWGAGDVCVSAPLVAQTAIAVVLTAAFVVLSLLFAAFVFESDELSRSLAAKAHGRADVAFVITKTLLVAVVDVFPVSLGTGAVVAAVAVGAAAWLTVYVVALPYVRHAANRAQAAVATAMCWVALCLVVATAAPSFQPTIAMYLGLPASAAAGCWIADARAAALARAPVTALRGGFDVGLRARFALHALLWGHATDESPAGAVEAGVARGASASDAAATAALLASSATDATTRAAAVRTALGAAALDGVEALYAAGAARFPASPMLRVFAARFYAALRDNHHLESRQLLAAERAGHALDVSFLIFAARRRAAARGNAAQLNAIARVSFEKHLSAARRHVKAALAAQARFWTALADAEPALDAVAAAAARMNAAVHAAEAAFGGLLAVNAHSIVALRLNADFALHVLHDEEKAGVLVGEADRLEDAQSRTARVSNLAGSAYGAHANIDAMADNVAVVTLGGTPENLGSILSANGNACKLFGFPRWQLELGNVAMLMPESVGAAHDGFMRRYLESGVSTLVDATRVVIGRHRSGALFPLALGVREAPAIDGPPKFIGMMQPLAGGGADLLWMDADFAVTGASGAALDLLGIDAETLAAAGADSSADGSADGGELRLSATASGAAADGAASAAVWVGAVAEAGGGTRGARGGDAAGTAAGRATHISRWVRDWEAVLPALAAGRELVLTIDPHASDATTGGSGPTTTPAVVGGGGAGGRRASAVSRKPSAAANGVWTASVLARLQSLRLGGNSSGALTHILLWKRFNGSAAAAAATTASAMHSASHASLLGSSGGGGGCPFRPIGASSSTPGGQPGGAGPVSIIRRKSVGFAAPMAPSPTGSRGVAERDDADVGSSKGADPLGALMREEAADDVTAALLPGAVTSGEVVATVATGWGGSTPSPPAASAGGVRAGRRPGTPPASMRPGSTTARQLGPDGRGRDDNASGGDDTSVDVVSDGGDDDSDAGKGNVEPTGAVTTSAVTAATGAGAASVALTHAHDGDAADADAAAAGGDRDGSSRGSSKRGRARKVQDRLRRIVVGDGAPSILPGLRMLRVVAGAVTVASVALAAATSAYEVSQLGRFAAVLTDALQAPTLALQSAASAHAVRTLFLLAEGWLTPAQANHDVVSANLLASAAAFGSQVRDTIDAEISLGVDASVGDPVLSVFVAQEPLVPGDSLIVQMQNLTLREAASVVQAAEESVATTTLANVTRYSANVEVRRR